MARVHSHQSLKVLECPDCHTHFCWINGRLPMYCPQCGQTIYTRLRMDPTLIKIRDDSAVLTYEDGT